MITKNQLKEYILDWIALYFGNQEAEDPCYNIDMLAEYVITRMEVED